MEATPSTMLYFPERHGMQSPALVTPLAELYVPLSQSLQSLSLFHTLRSEYLPAAHSAQSPSAPPTNNVPSYRPGPHAIQSSRLLLPVAAPYFPRLQCVHATSPGSSAYLPGGHASQSPPELLPEVERNRPAAHAVQSASVMRPVADEPYLPAVHAVHEPPAERWPAPHMQSASLPLAAPLAYLPASQSGQPPPSTAHAIHEFAEVPPAESPYCPSPHSMQLPLPVAPAYLPAAQLMHWLGYLLTAPEAYLPASQSVHPSAELMRAAVVAEVDVLYLPAPQAIQMMLPVLSAYVPRSQALH